MNKKYIWGVAIVFMTLFVGMAGYLTYFTLYKKDEMVTHPYNKRLDHLEEEIIRGTIYDDSLEVLATTEEENRIYPFKNTYAHLVGYSQQGKTGIEALANTQLLYPDYHFSALFAHAFYNEKFRGRDVVLTVENSLQQAAAEALGKNKGAVVMLEPATGKIKAMYSSPSFDPNTISENWETLTSDTSRSPLLNRATQGLYPPGSIFKILPAILLIQNYPDSYQDITYTCNGSITLAGHTISCYNQTAHGEVNLKKALTYSCNTFFVKLSEKLPAQQLEVLAKNLLFETSLPISMNHSLSQIRLTDTQDFNTLAAYMGQGNTLVTPLHMALLMGIIANDGVLMTPYIIDCIQSETGKIYTKNFPTYEKAYLNETLCSTLKQMLVNVVTEGTASVLYTPGLTIGGKTGTAQNETNEDHSWFIGFVTDESRSVETLAFAVIVENGGKGSQALTVSKKLIKAYQNLKKSS